MTQGEYRRFLAYYWVYTIVWVVLALLIAFVPNVPMAARWGLGALLAIVTPAGGQFTSHRAYLRWWQDHVVVNGEAEEPQSEK
ncbi:MAG TPA: hypothetical protein VEO54_19595 [Thermoanaerobaculia bacterium]|nr:hypothetical protein [Thermoanaerobaculia bacterium]